jgi:hypothetical protein
MMLLAPSENPSQKLNLIDSIQRLGMSYHFENEIQEILQQSYKTFHDLDNHENNHDLYTIALQFRLLRQQGYYISCGTFLEYFFDFTKMSCMCVHQESWEFQV